MFCGWCNAYLQLLVLMYLWITISHVFVCLPTLVELTIFEQHMCSTKKGYANAQSLGRSFCKNRNVATLKSADKAKSSVTLTVVGCKDSSAIYIASSDSCWKRSWKVKNIYSRTTTKSVPLLQPEQERGQLLASSCFFLVEGYLLPLKFKLI